MKVIYKYPIEIKDYNIVETYEDCICMSAQMQKRNGLNTLCIWIMVDTDSPKKNAVFRVLPTGIDLGEFEVENYVLVDTVQNAPFVWHVFFDQNETIAINKDNE